MLRLLAAKSFPNDLAWYTALLIYALSVAVFYVAEERIDALHTWPTWFFFDETMILSWPTRHYFAYFIVSGLIISLLKEGCLMIYFAKHFEKGDMRKKDGGKILINLFIAFIVSGLVIWFFAIEEQPDFRHPLALVSVALMTFIVTSGLTSFIRYLPFIALSFRRRK